MKQENFAKLIEKLRGLKWCFISGTAVSIYTNGKRKFQDLDILVGEKDIDKLAARLGVSAQKSIQKKGNTIIKDYRIETKFCGQLMEAVTNFPNDIAQLEIVRKTLKNRRIKRFMFLQVYVTPIEELIAQKSLMCRDKDITDLKLLKNYRVNSRLLEEFKQLWSTQIS